MLTAALERRSVPNQCIPFVDGDVLSQLMPNLIELIRSSVGLCTKAGCCFFLISLVQNCATELKPYADKAIKALVKQLSNRNATIQKTCADAIGHLVKLPSDKNTEALLKTYKEQYFEDDYRYRRVIAILFQTIAKHSGDIVRRHATLLMPFAFYALHEPKVAGEHEEHEHVEKYEFLWNEFTPGTGTPNTKQAHCAMRCCYLHVNS